MPQHTEREVARQKLLNANIDPAEIEVHLNKRFGGREVARQKLLKAKIDPTEIERHLDKRFGDEIINLPLPLGKTNISLRRRDRQRRKGLSGKEKLIEAAPAIGATALTLAAPQAGLLARLGLAVLGGGGGEAYKQIAGGRTGADASIPQNILDILKSGGEEGVYELGGEAVFRTGARVLGPVRKQAGKAFRKIKKAPELESGAAEAIKTIQQRTPSPPKGKLGTLLGTDQSRLVLTPGQATTGGIVDFAENVGEFGLGGGRLRKFKRGQQDIGPTVLDDFVAGVRRSDLGWAEVGDITIDTLKGKHSAFIGSFKGRYKALDKASQGITLNFDPILDFLAQVSEGRVAKGIGSSESGNKIIKEILNDPDIQAGTVGFMQADNLRSRLIKEAQQVGATNRKDVAIGLTKKVNEMLTQQMDRAARKLPKDVKPMWRQIRRDYAKGIEPFNSTLVRQLMSMDKMVAEKVTRKVMSPGVTQRELVNVKSIVGDKTFKDMSSIWLEQAVEDSTKKGVVKATALSNKLNQMKKGGKFDVMFEGEEARALKGISEYLQISQSGVGGGTGRVWIQLSQATAAGGLLTGAFLTEDKRLGAGGVVVLATPAVIAQLFTRPSTARLFIHGARLPKGSPQLAALAIRMTREIKKIEKEGQAEERTERARTLKEERRPAFTARGVLR